MVTFLKVHLLSCLVHSHTQCRRHFYSFHMYVCALYLDNVLTLTVKRYIFKNNSLV